MLYGGFSSFLELGQVAPTYRNGLQHRPHAIQSNEVSNEFVGSRSDDEVLQTELFYCVRGQSARGSPDRTYTRASLSTINLWWARSKSMSVNDIPPLCW